MVTGLDLVALQIRIAAGEKIDLPDTRPWSFRGHAIECRINAEDPVTFAPWPGLITEYFPPGGTGVRVDSGVYGGWRVPSTYDSLLAKLIVHAATRGDAILRMRRALDEFIVTGIRTNIDLHKRLLADEEVIRGTMTTHTIERTDLRQAGPLMKHTIACGALAFAVLCASSSSAQPSPRALAAEELFRDGRALIAQHHYKEACEKLRASQKIEPAVGTLVSLGECYAGQGRTASAWLAYRSAVALATERGDPRRAAAEERAGAMEPRISNLAIRMTVDATLPAVQNLDRRRGPQPRGARHARPHRPWPPHDRRQRGRVRDVVQPGPGRDSGRHRRRRIPPLERLPDASVIEHARKVAAARRVTGLVVGGAGLVGLNVGAILGLQAIVKIRGANQVCSGSNACNNASAVHDNQVGKDFADAATVTLPISAAIVAAGAYLFFASRSPRSPEVDAAVSRGTASVRVGWTW